ncbi:hypothetical protein D3C86_1869670 [compost metagenome]
MAREVVVLGGQQGIDEVLGDVGEVDRAAAHFAELGDQLVIGAIDPQRDLHAHIAQGFDRGQARAEIEVGAAEAKQYGTEQGDTGPRQKLQQAHRESCLSRERNELSGWRREKAKTDHIISVFSLK